MAHKPSNKADKKKSFFGEHLEIKPAFMQRPKTMEEVMAEAFSKQQANNAKTETTVEESTVEHNTIVEHKATVAQNKEEIPSIVKEQLAVAEQSTIDLPARVVGSTVAVKTVEEKESSNKYFTHSDSKEFTDSLEFTLTAVAQPTVAYTPIVTEKTNVPTIEQTTVVNSATVVEQAIKPTTIPARLRSDITFLSRMIATQWQPLSDTETNSTNYLQGYVEAWHWIEDEILPHLDKDSKLTLRRCYRKAFADPKTKGRFFAGQTSLAQEVGLSKRRIQDILEIFNILGWVRKIAHHNRGGHKGTDYEMYLPSYVIKFFL